MALTLDNLNGVEKPRFAEFVRAELYKKLVFVNSGVMKQLTPAELGLIYSDGARLVHLPYWAAQSYVATDLIDTNTAVTALGNEAGQQTGRMLYKGRGWAKSWLAKQLAGGSDPMADIASLIADFWANIYHEVAVSTLAGMFGTGKGLSDLLEDRYMDSTGDAIVTGATLRDGMYKMGDQFDKIKLMLCHPTVYAKLDLSEDIIMVPEASGLGLYPTLRGTNIRIHPDGTMPYVDATVPVVAADCSVVYFMSEGAMILTEMDDYVKAQENASAGSNAVYNRKAFLVHPNGISWQSSAPTNASGQAVTPTNTQLATNANWSRTWDVNNIKIVRQDVKVA